MFKTFDPAASNDLGDSAVEVEETGDRNYDPPSPAASQEQLRTLEMTYAKVS